MKKKILSFVLTSAILFSLLFTFSVQAATTEVPTAGPTVKIGDYFLMGKYLNKPILWRCVDIDENGPLILANKAICHKAYDAAGSHKYLDGKKQKDDWEEDRLYFGSNLWQTSSLRAWLNSSAPAGKVKWLDGCKPDSDHVDSELPYAKEKGFLSTGNFTAGELSVLKSVSQKTLLNALDAPKLKVGGTGEKQDDDVNSTFPPESFNYSVDRYWIDYDAAYYHNVTDKMFVLSQAQLYKVFENGSILGKKYYQGTVWIGRGKTPSAGFEYHYMRDEGNWLRDAWEDSSADNSTNVFIIQGSSDWEEGTGGISWAHANSGANGVRPAFYMNLPTAVIKSGNGTAGKPYVLTGKAS